MNYQETLDYLFNALPMFQRIGAAAFKKDLSNTIKLCDHLDQPQHKFKSIHIAGTNGKGSSSHMLAAILQEAGYKVGLYTSPHLKSFTERIKINGQEIPEQKVVDYVATNRAFLDELKPSFFEMSVGLAFQHFAEEKVDYAVVEVGMGGRLDSTNVLRPEACLITNIGLDHTQFLGDTLPLIAAEKGGIIKQDIPVIISQAQAETIEVFIRIAQERNAPIFFADTYFEITKKGLNKDTLLNDYLVDKRGEMMEVSLDLLGDYQQYNLGGLMMTVEVLQEQGLKISIPIIQSALRKAGKSTGLKGRFQQLSASPLILCDTAHNADGLRIVLNQLKGYKADKYHFILGMVNDKDIGSVLSLFPKEASYYFCQANIPRALAAEELLERAKEAGLEGEIIADVNQAIEEVSKKAKKNELIFVGGSTFVVAEIENL